MTESILIRGATLVDAGGSRSEDLAIVDGVIVDRDSAPSDAHTIDATGCIVSTGLVDLHAHLGEPGDEAAETMESGGRAAVAGGFTTVLAMPDTFPPVDTAAVVEHVRALSKAALCHVAIAGAITVERAGTRLAPLGELAEAGVCLVTDCGTGVQDPLMLRRALEYASPFDLIVAQPANCESLTTGAQMHEGEWSSRLGLPGAPAEAEEINVMRDVALARLTGARLHFQTLSTAGSFAIVAAARSAGVAVTAEVASHHLTLSDADLATYDTNKKVEPPLRPSSDVEAAIAAVAASTVDAIVSDHTPCTTDRKERPFDHAEVGSAGLETTLAASLSTGLSLEHLLAALSWRPAEMLGLGAPAERSLRPGAAADIVVIDPEQAVPVSTAHQETLATNSAFEGAVLTGSVRATIVAGRVAVEEMKVVA